MLRWPRDPKAAIQPGLAEKWEFNSDGTALTLTLRKGLKWSDGQPFTTDDILFWWNDIALDTNLYPAPPPEWVINGKQDICKVETPPLRDVAGGHVAACHFADTLELAGVA
jgi:peptide/nickel transport system substrate-binding protein